MNKPAWIIGLCLLLSALLLCCAFRYTQGSGHVLDRWTGKLSRGY